MGADLHILEKNNVSFKILMALMFTDHYALNNIDFDRSELIVKCLFA